MANFVYAFERLDALDNSERFVFLTLDEFDIFFSGRDAFKARQALAWQEFNHSAGGRMIKTDMDRAKLLAAET